MARMMGSSWPTRHSARKGRRRSADGSPSVRARIQCGRPRAFRRPEPPNQNGPEEMGWRTTAQNLNLNRDYMKADAPEMQAMLGLLCEWDPVLCADLHVTDGADFEPDISLQSEPVNQGDPELFASGREMRDELIEKLAAQGFLPLPFYPDFAKLMIPRRDFCSLCIRHASRPAIFPRATVSPFWSNALMEGLRATSPSHLQHDCQSRGAVCSAWGSWEVEAHQADEAAIRLGGSDVTLAYKSRSARAHPGGRQNRRPGSRLMPRSLSSVATPTRASRRPSRATSLRLTTPAHHRSGECPTVTKWSRHSWSVLLSADMSCRRLLRRKSARSWRYMASPSSAFRISSRVSARKFFAPPR